MVHTFFIFYAQSLVSRPADYGSTSPDTGEINGEIPKGHKQISKLCPWVVVSKGS